MRPEAALLFLLAGGAVLADTGPFDKVDIGGHTKFRLTDQAYPEDSLLRDPYGANALDLGGELRLTSSASDGPWSFAADYQLFALHGDSVAAAASPPGLSLFPGYAPYPDDGRRLFDMTDVIHEAGDTAVVQRLDRLWAAYTTDRLVIRAGRQALSWGNGLFYAPMDLVNPFDPATIDTEFKTGDDMLYLQYLRDSGDDIQAAIVFRRDPVSGDAQADERTAAVKYHGFIGDREFDLLLADSYGNTVVGVGGVTSAGGAVFRGDLVMTAAGGDTYVEAVANVSYSWTWGGRNVSGSVEYYFNGFGQHDGDYALPDVAMNTQLSERLVRGESYTLGRHYLAGSLLVEVTPLFTVTPTLLFSVSGPSALFQLVTQVSLADNMTLLGSVNLPLGPDGSEFGGIASGLPDSYLSSGPGIFAQFAWYF
jgi:hypothetical protein